MNCKNCGAPLALNDGVCKNCGAVVNTQNVQGASLGQMQQPLNPSVQSGAVQQGQVINSQVGQQQVKSGQVAPIVNNQLQNQPQQVVQSSGVQPQQVVQSSVVQPQQVSNNQQLQPNTVNNNLNGGQNISNQTNVSPKKSSGGFIKFLLGFILGAAIFGGLYFYNSMNNKSNSIGSTNSSSESLEDSSVVSSSTTSKSYKVKFKDFILTLPDNLIYQEKEDVLLIGDKDGTWFSKLGIYSGDYAKIKSNINNLQSLIKKDGFTVSDATVKTLGGVEFITMEISKEEENVITSLAELNSTYFVGITIENRDSEFDYELLETIAPIINSISDIDTINNISSTIEIDMSGIVDLAKSDDE